MEFRSGSVDGSLLKPSLGRSLLLRKTGRGGGKVLGRLANPRERSSMFVGELTKPDEEFEGECRKVLGSSGLDDWGSGIEEEAAPFSGRSMEGRQ